MTLTEQTLTANSLDWFYREIKANFESDYAPVLLLHGLPSQSLTWRGIMPPLAEKGFRAIAPDWIGSGFSAKPEKRDFSYTPARYLAALGEFIDALGLDRLSLVVQGFLATVGLQYALQHSDKIDRLVILNTPLAPGVKLPWKMAQWGVPFMGDMVTQDPLLVDRTLEGGSGFVIADQYLDVYRKPFLKTSATGRALVATTKNLNLSQTLADIQEGLNTWEKPTLIIWGMADPWLSVDNAETLANAHHNIELVKLEEAKHYPQEHWFEEISPLIVNFLRRSA